MVGRVADLMFFSSNFQDSGPIEPKLQHRKIFISSEIVVKSGKKIDVKKSKWWEEIAKHFRCCHFLTQEKVKNRGVFPSLPKVVMNNGAKKKLYSHSGFQTYYFSV